MKKIHCLTIVTLFLFTFLVGCRSTTVTDPAGESESASAESPSISESEAPASTPSAPTEEPAPEPKPLYPELPLPAEQILWSVSDFNSDAVFMFGKLMGLPSVQDVCNPEKVSDDQCVAFSLYYSHNDAHQLPEGFKETLEHKGFAVHKSKKPDQLFLFVTRKQVNEAEFTEEELQSIWLEFIREEYYRQNVAPVGYEN